MPTLPGSRLIAIGQVVLQTGDPQAIRIVDVIWNHRVFSNESGASPGSIGYQWEYNVNISQRDAEHVLAVLQREPGDVLPSDPDRKKLVTELAGLWRVVCRELR